jgi:hypothetical protein
MAQSGLSETSACLSAFSAKRTCFGLWPCPLERGLGLCRCDRRHEISPLRQPQPDLRHVGKGQPRIAVSERGGRFEALLCAPPILVCPTHHCHSSPFVR